MHHRGVFGREYETPEVEADRLGRSRSACDDIAVVGSNPARSGGEECPRWGDPLRRTEADTLVEAVDVLAYWPVARRWIVRVHARVEGGQRDGCAQRPADRGPVGAAIAARMGWDRAAFVRLVQAALMLVHSASKRLGLTRAGRSRLTHSSRLSARATSTCASRYRRNRSKATEALPQGADSRIARSMEASRRVDHCRRPAAKRVALAPNQQGSKIIDRVCFESPVTLGLAAGRVELPGLRTTGVLEVRAAVRNLIVVERKLACLLCSRGCHETFTSHSEKIAGLRPFLGCRLESPLPNWPGLTLNWCRGEKRGLLWHIETVSRRKQRRLRAGAQPRISSWWGSSPSQHPLAPMTR